jgi:hypothetical protein
MISWLTILTFVLLGASGLLWSGILFSHKRILTFLATAGLLVQLWWMFISLFAHLPFAFLVGSAVALVVGIYFKNMWRWPYSRSGSGLKDFWVLIALLLVGGFAYAVGQFNGLQADHSWVWHGFYNGDTATFISLVQKSMVGSTGNPFGAGLDLEYPTVWHHALGLGLKSLHLTVDWIFYLPTLTLLWVFLTIPMFFLLFDTLEPEGPRRVWVRYLLEALVVLYVLALSWDAFVYPQSHFFLMGLFMLLLNLIYKATRETPSRRILLGIVAFLTAALLLLSNAVTGTAAIACILLWLFFLALDKRNAPPERVISLGLLLVVVIFFFAAAPGAPQFGSPHFAYSSIPDMMFLVPALIVVGAALSWLLFSFPLAALLFVGLSGLAFVIFFFSNRDIVVANASRFFYHALLVSFPIVLPLLVRLFYVLRRELLLTTHTLVARISGIAIIGMGVILLCLPAVAGIASATDNLFFQDEHTFSISLVEANWWLADHTDPKAVVVANPEPPWSVPVMTGRSLLRAAYPDGSAYWLSANDVTLHALQAAFTGDATAQAQVMGQGDYLLLTKEESLVWQLGQRTKAFDNGAFLIFALK